MRLLWLALTDSGPSQNILNILQPSDHLAPLQPVTRRLSLATVLLKSWLLYLLTTVRCALYGALWSISGRWGWRIHTTVAHLPFGLVLKSTRASHGDGDALRMLDTLRVNSVNAPILIDSVHDGHVAHALSTYVDGEWCPAVHDLSRQDKERLVGDVRNQFASLYSQTHTTIVDHPICTISYTTVVDPRVSWVSERGLQLRSNEEFFRQVWLGIDFEKNQHTVRPRIEPVIIAARVERIVFCHGDLAERNLIFPGGLSAWRQGRSRVCLIDWEFAGWMPEPWDALKATISECEADNEWTRMVRAIFPRAGQFLDADWIWRAEAGMGII
ncbi:hypothetical protein BD410DRAFT_895306 [Rickenella mellea]|uniref:Aminoglycoside phosphotransferase domain-containing protein n=1 Tax=Rickenella mellea TaxID=50990 RepID=A0A4Y7QH51_9AGAM|nr:hypothetical protein BD410DRAFT_895306 [Rickenella mellea]